MSDRDEIIRDLKAVINRHSLENGSNTPDFLLAEYLLDALDTFTKTSVAREKWYGKKLEIKYEPQATKFYTQAEWDDKHGLLETNYGSTRIENNDKD